MLCLKSAACSEELVLECPRTTCRAVSYASAIEREGPMAQVIYGDFDTWGKPRLENGHAHSYIYIYNIHTHANGEVSTKLYIYDIDINIYLSVVPHKAVAEASKIGNL